jgi:hypothetical protein
MIDGVGMTREGPGSRWTRQAGEFPVSMAGLSAEEMAILVPDLEAMERPGQQGHRPEERPARPAGRLHDLARRPLRRAGHRLR